MRSQIACALVAFLQFGGMSPINGEKQIGKIISGLPNILENQSRIAVQQQQNQLVDTVSQIQSSIAQSEQNIRDIQNDYKTINTDIGEPLAEKVQSLKEERNTLMRRISALTKNVRALYDAAHPEMKNSPLIIVAKSKSDDMRSTANVVDAKGQMDALRGIISPCADFHKSRQMEKSEIMATVNADPYKIESEALNRMSPDERINYDRNMAQEFSNKILDIQQGINAAERDARRRGLLAPKTFPYAAFQFPTPLQA